MSIANNLLVLLGNAFYSVENHQYYITAVNGTQATHYAILFNGLVNFALAAHACSINEQELLLTLQQEHHLHLFL